MARDPIAVLTLFLFIIGGWQVELSRRTARAQLRAYVLMHGADLYDNNDPAPAHINQQGLVTVVLTIQNFGTTPAHDVRHSAGITIQRTIDEEKVIFPKVHSDMSRFTMGMNSPITKTVRFNRQLTEFEISDLRTGVNAIYVCGLITYKDTFNTKHTTTYKMRFNGHWPIGMGVSSPLYMCESGNEAT